MDLPTDRSTPTSAPPIHPTLREAARSPRRRRPTGAAPPLPYRLQSSGIGWLVAAVVRWLASLVGPGLVAPLRALARISSWWVLYTLLYGLVLVLLVLRRWRHLLVWLVVVQLAGPRWEGLDVAVLPGLAAAGASFLKGVSEMWCLAIAVAVTVVVRLLLASF